MIYDRLLRIVAILFGHHESHELLLSSMSHSSMSLHLLFAHARVRTPVKDA